MKKRRWNRKDSERGAVMIIVAFFVTVALGFSALAVDAGGWMVSQRSNQNAADAAAYAAVDARGLQGKSKSEAKQMAYKAAVNNTSDALSPEQVMIEWSGWDTMTSPRATVTILTDSPNYYYTSNKSTTDVAASSTAQLYSEPGAASDLAIDAAEGIQLSEGGYQDLTGNLESGGDFLITNYAKIKGDIVVDGNVHLNSGRVFTLEGGVDAGGNVQVNTPMTINGNVSAQGTFEWNSGDGGTINGNVKSGKNVRNLQGVTVNGSISENSKPKHRNYVWRWDDKDDEFEAYQKGEAADVAEITKDLVNEFNELHRYDVAGSSQWYNNMGNVILYQDWNKGLEIRNTSSEKGGMIGADEFFNFVKHKTGKKNIYIPGGLTIQCHNDSMDFDGTICAGQGIKLTTGGMTVNGNTTFMALKNGFTSNSTGSDFILHGSIINMDSNAGVDLKAGGARLVITGGMISKGTMTANSPLTIIPDGSLKTRTKTIRYVNLTNK